MKNILKRVVSLLLVVVMFIGILPSSAYATGTESTGANKRINTFIKLANQKSIYDEDINGLTQEELRFLGVFLSNYYVPFKTEIGISGTTEGSVMEYNKKQMTDVLKSSIGMSEDVASSLVETILGYSRSSASETKGKLKFYVSKDYQDGNYTELTNVQVTYYNFLCMMLSGGDEILALSNADSAKAEIPDDADIEDDDGDDEDSGEYDLSEFLTDTSGYNYMYVGYNGTNFIADSKLGGNGYTASQVAFLKCLESTDLQNGYGTNILDFTIDEMDLTKKDQEELKEYVNTYKNSPKVLLETTIFGLPMAVDCFGDIICCGPNHQYIAVPACMNPYNFVKVDENGNDSGNVGKYYPVINSISIAQTAMSPQRLYRDEDLYTDVKQFVPDFTILDAYIDDMDTALFFKGDTTLRLVMGSSDTDPWAPGPGTSPYTDMLKTTLWNYVKENIKDPTIFLQFFSIKKDKFDIHEIKRPLRSGSFSENPGNVAYVDGFCYMDTLGAVENVEYNLFNYASFLSSDSAMSLSVSTSDFESKFTQAKSGSAWLSNLDSQTAMSLYVTYAVACFGSEEGTATDSIGQLGFRIDSSNFPKIPAKPLKFDNVESVDTMFQDIENWMYYILHPTSGFTYFRVWITNKLNHLLLGWHYDMTGTNNVGALVGTTAYKSNMGYVTMPDLTEIQWTSSLINFYYSIIGFIAVFVVITMVLAMVIGVLRPQHAVAAACLFIAFLFIPIPLINGVVGVSNRISQNVYGLKFTYWALVQEESYGTSIDEAAEAASDNSGSYENYLKTLYSNNASVYSNSGSNSVLLKWQAPKKFASVSLAQKDSAVVTGGSLSKMLRTGLNSAYSGQSFIDDEDATYMYRSYVDISNFSRYVFRGIQNKYVDSIYLDAGHSHRAANGMSSVHKDNWYSDLRTAVSDLEKDTNTYKTLGYMNQTVSLNNYDQRVYLGLALSSNIVNDQLANAGTVKDMTLNDYVGINQDLFNMGIPMFNNNDYLITSDNIIATAGIDAGSKRSDAVKEAFNNYNESDFVGLAAYSLYSENPFYFFSWKLYSDGLSAESHNDHGGYKDLLLGTENGGYFYNIEGNGELKDFMDMRGLFTYVIPYLKQCNDLVREWDNLYGVFIYDGVPVEEGHEADVANDPELKQKYWHNVNVARLYGMYTPWVDLMYDCDYSKPETIRVFGQDVTIEDPINPASYPDDRPMIFSETEMLDYGLSYNDLTTVEKKILDCNNGFQERMFDLLNYYNFSDIALDTSAALNCAFVFNNTFSETNIFGENHDIYPQSFDLADFSYDAFLRLILATNTGEELLGSSYSGAGTMSGESTKDFYERLVGKSSILTTIVMLILDVVCQYLLPGVRIFFLMATFIGSILVIFAHLVKVKESAKFYRNLFIQIVSPMLKFFAVTVSFSLIISLFVGVGSDAVTQTGNVAIQLGDPVMTMLVILILDIVCLILYVKILTGILKGIKSNAVASAGFVGGVFTGATVAAFSSAAGAMSRIGGFGEKGVSGGSGDGGTLGGVEAGGTGKTSSRAEARAANGKQKVVNKTVVKGNQGKTQNNVSFNFERNKYKGVPVANQEPNRDGKEAKEATEDINKKSKEGSNKLKSYTIKKKEKKKTTTTKTGFLNRKQEVVETGSTKEKMKVHGERKPKKKPKE